MPCRPWPRGCRCGVVHTHHPFPLHCAAVCVYWNPIQDCRCCTKLENRGWCVGLDVQDVVVSGTHEQFTNGDDMGRVLLVWDWTQDL